MWSLTSIRHFLLTYSRWVLPGLECPFIMLFDYSDTIICCNEQNELMGYKRMRRYNSTARLAVSCRSSVSTHHLESIQRTVFDLGRCELGKRLPKNCTWIPPLTWVEWYLSSDEVRIPWWKERHKKEQGARWLFAMVTQLAHSVIATTYANLKFESQNFSGE